MESEVAVTNNRAFSSRGGTFLSGGGEMSALMRSIDWSKTPLGSLEDWPQSLRTVVNILLTSRYAMWMGWGEKLTFLYNDAYRPTLGIKHPWALGSPANEVWAEIWRDIGPRIQTVLSTGEATYDEGLLLFLQRSGFPEETYHTFSYSPLADDAGQVSGMLCVVTEETERVISERRMTTLRDLAARLAASNTEIEVLDAVREELGGNTKDLPFTLTYLYEGSGKARLSCATGIPDGRAAPPGKIECGANFPWPVGEIFLNPVPRILEDVSERWHEPLLPTGAWDRAPEQAALVPIKQQGQDRPAGFLVVGLNPYRRYDSAYSGFVGLITVQLAAALANARAYEEERQRAEMLSELDRAKTTFFSNVSHELRTPLTLILGPLEEMMAMDGTLPPAVAEMASVTHRNGLRLQKLVNALLDFSRIEAGRVQASYEPANLSIFTEELASTFRSVMEKAGLEFSVYCPPLSEPVYVDRDMWEKIVLNLLSNAFKYTFQGAVSVRLERQDGRAVLSVSDTGTGIPEKELPHLFERFHRVEGARGRTQEGTGIGLALVAELVNLHGGTVEARSTVGQGSTFFVSLPFGTEHLPSERLNAARTVSSTASKAGSYVGEAARWLPDEVQVATSVEDSRPATRSIPGGRVLVADDNADMRGYVARLLSSLYDVEVVGNGAEALSRAVSNPPDLVLSDVMMPELSGFELLHALRTNPTTSTVPVILLSARAGEEAKAEGMDAGADDYLIKPFSARELLARVGAHLKLSRARKEAEERAKGILESITDGFLALDRDWRFTYVNAEAERLNGMHRQDMLGRNHWELFPKSIGTTVHRELLRAASELIPVEFDNYYGPWDLWFHIKAYPTDEGGLSVFYEDITDRKRAEAALRESESQFQILAESMPQLCWMANPDGHIFWFNRRWYDYTGTTPEEMEGWGWQSVHDVDVLPAVLERWKSSVTSGNRFEMVFPLKGADGRFRPFLTRVEPLKDAEGKVRRWFGTNTDVDELERAREALRRANSDLEQFAFAAAHDLQEPLRTVQSYTQLLSRRIGGKLERDDNLFMGYILDGSRRMGDLVKDLREYLEVATTEIEVENTLVDLTAAFNKAVQNLDVAIRETGATVTSGTLPTVLGREVHFVQLFQNLMSNAIKYRRDGEPPYVSIAAVKKGGHWVVSVKDNGIGIPSEHQERIFGLFKRLHGMGVPGTGIGLAICQKISERYGGRISVQSKVGEGSTFCFTVPVQVSEI